MKFPFSARLGVYFILFGVLCQLLYINWPKRGFYIYPYPSMPFPIALLIASGIVLIIQSSITKVREEEDLFDRATRRGFIAAASPAWESAANRTTVPRVSPLRRPASPEYYCLKLSTLALFYAMGLMIAFATFVMGVGYGRSWRADHIFGLRVYVAGPSGMAAPWIERSQDKLLVKVSAKTQWYLDSKPVSQEALQVIIKDGFLWTVHQDASGLVTDWQLRPRMIEQSDGTFCEAPPTDQERRKIRSVIETQWSLNSKPMTQEEVQKALREDLPCRRGRFVYLDVNRNAAFRVVAHAIEVVQQAPHTRVVLVTDDQESAR